MKPRKEEAWTMPDADRERLVALWRDVPPDAETEHPALIALLDEWERVTAPAPYKARPFVSTYRARTGAWSVHPCTTVLLAQLGQNLGIPGAAGIAAYAAHISEDPAHPCTAKARP